MLAGEMTDSPQQLVEAGGPGRVVPRNHDLKLWPGPRS
jgi:hypothetical protein